MRLRFGGAPAAALGLALVGAAVTARAIEPGGAAESESACELQGAVRAGTSSTACMACHDGGSGPGVSFRMPRAADTPGLDHPIEIDYAQASARNGWLVSPGELPAELVLVEGRVSCTTCHDGASSEPRRVAGRLMDLCTSCHRL